jgi:glutamyl-tRNA synthetase
MPDKGTTTFHDLVLGDITYDNRLLDDQILIKSDGFPTYNFANVVDDHMMGITHVIRGSEFLPSTPKYTLLYEAFEWEAPAYIHVPPLMKSATAKLSKRDGDVSYEDFITKGYLKEALLNYVLLLGWNPGTEREFFTLDEMVAEFDAGRISKSPAIFDMRKLTWMNGEYLRKLPVNAFHAKALPYLRKSVTRNNLDLLEVSKLLQSRIDTFGEIPEHIDFLDQVPEHSADLYANDKMKVSPDKALDHLRMLHPVLAALPAWNADAIRDALFSMIHESGLKTGQVLWPLRVALSGKRYTPGGGIELAALLGKDETLTRVGHAIERLQANQAGLKRLAHMQFAEPGTVINT